MKVWVRGKKVVYEGQKKKKRKKMRNLTETCVREDREGECVRACTVSGENKSNQSVN